MKTTEIASLVSSMIQEKLMKMNYKNCMLFPTTSQTVAFPITLGYNSTLQFKSYVRGEAMKTKRALCSMLIL